MATTKITDLTAYTDPVNTDVLPIVDVTSDVTKKVSIANVMKNASLGTAALPGIAFDGDPNTGIYSPGADQLAISTNGSGRLFVDASGRVGIGAAEGAYAASVTTTGNNGFLVKTGTASAVQIYAGNTAGEGALGTLTNDPLNVITNGSSRIRITSAGLVGIGDSAPTARLVCNGSIQVTSSTNPSTGAGLEIGYGTVNASRTALQSYNRTGSAWLGADYNALDHRFYISGGGSPQMTLTSTGLGIGTTTPDTLTHLYSSTAKTTVGESDIIRLAGQSTDNTVGARLEIGFNYAASSRKNFATIGYITTDTTSFCKGDLYFATRNVTTDTAPTERARIDSSGRLLVGTSTSLPQNSQLQVVSAVAQAATLQYSADNGSGAYLNVRKSRGTAGSPAEVNNNDLLGGIVFQGYDGAAYQDGAYLFAEADGTWTDGGDTSDNPTRLVFSTTADGASSPTERMTINNTGSVRITASTSVVGGTHTIRDSGASPNTVRLYNDTDANSTGSTFLICDAGASVLRAQIRTNGGLANYQANNVNLSDRNTKKDITPAAGTWDCIKEWEIVNYRYKDQPDDADLNLGVIAQQVAESCPEVITVFEEAKDDQPEKLGIKEQQMYWMAIKALQEAQVRIEALEVEVAALKAQ